MSPPDGLGRSATRGAAVTMSGQMVRLAVTGGGLVILARMLSPEDFGLAAMITALVGVANILRDFGLSSAAVQSRQLTRAQRDNLFWINAALGLAFGLVVYVSAGFIADFYAQPRLESLTMALASTFVLGGLSTQFRASLSRSMKFGSLATIETISPAVALVAAIIFASLGFGVWALVIQQIVDALTGLILSAAFARYVPGLPKRRADMSYLFRFGLNLTGTQLVTYASRNLDSVVVGSTLGPTALGLYSRAFQLLTLPMQQISAPASRVALPVLSKLQDDQKRFDAFILRGQTVLLHVVSAVFAIGAALGGPLIILVLGDQWIDAAPLFQILCIAGFGQAAGYSSYWIFISNGLTSSHLRFTLLTSPAVVIAIFVGARWGAEGVAWGVSAFTLLTWPAGLIWLSRISEAPVLSLFLNGVRALIGYGFASLIAFGAAQFTPPVPLLQIAAGLSGLLVAVTLECWVWPAFRRDVFTILKTGSLLRAGQRP